MSQISTLPKRNQAYTQAIVFNCLCCNSSITTNSSQRGMKRTKCDSCRKERDRLVNVMYYWMKKVGIKFDIEDFEKDFDELQDDGLEEFD